MPNDFEKQVKEKMDELTFVPTAPVWEHIEKQIRAKKDRRRFLLWLPLIILVTGGGTWLLRNGQTNKHVRGSVDKQMHKLKKVTEVPTNNRESQRGMEQGTDSKHSTNSTVPFIHHSQKLANKNTNRNGSSTKAGLLYSNGSMVFSKDKPQVQQVYTFLKEEQANDYNIKRNDSKPPTPYIPEHVLYEPGFTFLTDSVKPRLIIKDTATIVDSPLVKTRKVNRPQWQIGINASTGYSGISKSFGVFPASLQADAGSVTGSYNNYNGYRSSPVNKNHAYTIGARAKKDLSHRVSFAFGIDYQYYSTVIKVGQRLQDTLIGLNNSVSRNYMGYGPVLQDYVNQYHFISLPVSLEWKTGAHIPLYIEGSFSFQQMIHTNGLVFNGSSGNYYADQSAYNKTQLMAGLGLSYGLLRSTLFIGPQAQFGLRKMEKNSASNHLVYAGLQARYFFKNN
jgi:hypothetical protein